MFFNKEVRKEIDVLKRRIESRDRRIEDLDNKNEKQRIKISDLEETNAVLEGKLDAQTDLTTRRTELEADEKLFKAEKKAFGDVQKKMKELTEKAEEADGQGYKKGYADGIADGLRKAHEIAAEDRKNMSQIAALAAASHSSEATTKIADQIVKGMHALPEGTKSTK